MRLITILLVGFSSVCWSAYAQSPEDVRRAIHAEGADADVERFYEMRSYRSAWFGDGAPDGAIDALHRVLGTLHESGMDAVRYGMEDSLADASRQDVRTTRSALLLAREMLGGRVEPRQLVYGWTLARRQADLPAQLATALQAGTLEHYYRSLAPPHQGYKALLRARAEHVAVRDRGGWTVVPAGEKLRIGDVSPRVRALRRRLASTDGLAPEGMLFDYAVEEAVRAFQGRHGLDVDGIVGPQTLGALNVSVSQRLDQIDVNLERWRWLPSAFGSLYVHINVAGFELVVNEDGRERMAMKVIVGTPHTRTPLFSSRIMEVVLAPYWYVPRSIEIGEILPRIAANPAYLAQHAMRRLSNGTLRQDPGPSNPMGEVKFTVPNEFGVGLHDTPERHLFQRSVCALSHGCMRVERPVDLASYFLSGTEWSRDRIEQTIDHRKQTIIPLVEPIPLYVMYWTAWLDDDGTMHFRPDVYGYDAALLRALSAK